MALCYGMYTVRYGKEPAMPKRGHVIGNPDELGVSLEVQEHLVQMARDYLAGRPAPEAPSATADVPLAEPGAGVSAEA